MKRGIYNEVKNTQRFNNASAAEEISSSAQMLNEQATLLEKEVAFFKIKKNESEQRLIGR
ncbi:MAG: hypothetical protein FWE37_04135 [Spirochaetaceae bacterium]|nr:hypothetical protein [Spirochaetaceae bacterium]